MRDDEESDWPHRLLDRLARAPLVPERQQPGLLTAREERALMLASYGMREPECAALMDVTEEAVKTYWRQARRKLRAKNTCHAVALALRAGLIV
jgi:DNA-binding CsgD family transcriptional regulator